MRTKTEIQLLNLRQTYKDYLLELKTMPVTPLENYRKVYVRFLICEELLNNYRNNEKKYKDIA